MALENKNIQIYLSDTLDDYIIYINKYYPTGTLEIDSYTAPVNGYTQAVSTTTTSLTYNPDSSSGFWNEPNAEENIEIVVTDTVTTEEATLFVRIVKAADLDTLALDFDEDALTRDLKTNLQRVDLNDHSLFAEDFTVREVVDYNRRLFSDIAIEEYDQRNLLITVNPDAISSMPAAAERDFYLMLDVETDPATEVVLRCTITIPSP